MKYFEFNRALHDYTPLYDDMLKIIWRYYYKKKRGGRTKAEKRKLKEVNRTSIFADLITLGNMDRYLCKQRSLFM